MTQRVLFTASSYSHIAHFHRPYLRAFQERGWEVHVACGGAALPLPEADRVFFVPFEKKPTFEYEINSEDIEVKINSVQPYGVRLEVSWGDRENVPDAPPILEYYAF